MKNNQLCTKCNINECIDKNISVCAQCVNNNLTVDVCEQLMMFKVNTKNTSSCICGANASKSCILQCCKQCCAVNNCTLHCNQYGNFIFNKCTLCDTNKEILNFYCVQNKNKSQLISYCGECYIKNKKILNLLIFNNTTPVQRKKFKIPVSETKAEKTQRSAINNKTKNKMTTAQKQQNKKNEIKSRLQYLKSCSKNGTYNNLLLNKHINLIDNDIIDLLENETLVFSCSCDSICDFESVYHCKYCDLYKCEECTFSSVTVCDYEKCNYPDNLCIHSSFKCKECVNNKINDFSKNNVNVKITSLLLNTAEIDVRDFDNNLCDNIFNCDICKEDVNLTYTKISKCDVCNNFCCNKCGIFKKEHMYTLLFNDNDDDEDDEIKFTCTNCIKKDTTINDDDDVITIKSKSFIKFESDVPATSKDEECAVCYTNKKVYACIPCGHLCLCYKCKNGVKDKCPMCNEEFYDIFKIYA